MKKIAILITEFILHGKVESDELLIKPAQFFAFSYLVSLFIMFFFACLNLLIGNIPNGLSQIVGFLFILISPLLYRFLGEVFGLWWLIFSGFLGVFGTVKATGGMGSPAMYWFTSLPVIAGLVGGKRHLLLGLVFTLCIIFAIYFGYGVTPVAESYREHYSFLNTQLRSLLGITFEMALCTFFFLYLVSVGRRKILEKSDHVNNLLRVVCHDVANPLSIIDGRSELAIRSYEGEHEAVAHLKQVKQATRAIKEIINQVRDMQAYESGKLKLNMKEVFVKDIIKNGQFIFHDKLQEKKLNLVIQQFNQEVKVLADEYILSNQIFNNILSNAIKFSRVGDYIFVDVKENAMMVEILIRDKGIGIPSEILEKIYSSNSTTSRIGTNGERGTGFGMPIVKKFVEAFGGQVFIASYEESLYPGRHGTEVCIMLKKA